MGIIVGDEYRVNTYTANVQDSAQVTVLPDGGWVVTWRSFTQDDGTGSGVYQQIYNADGTPRGGEVHVNTFTVGNQSLPQIATLSDGGWIIAWRSDGQDGSSYGVYQQAFNADGTRQGVEQHVSTYTNSDQNTPSVVALADGGWVVTWQSNGQDGSSYGIYQQVYDSDGTKQGIETHVNTGTTNSQELQQILALPDGGWVIAWRSDGQDGSGGGVYQQVYNADGSTRGTETRVNTFTSGNQEQPQFTLLLDGGWVVTWQSDIQDGSNYGIYQQVFNADGSKSGSEVQVNTNTGNYQYNPQITTLLDGGWVVTWQSYTQDGSGDGIYQQVFNANGTLRGIETRVNTFAGDDQEIPQITALTTGGWVVTWQSYLQDGSNGGIYTQAYKADGTPDGVETRVNTYTNDKQYNPQVTALPDGSWIITWWSTGEDGSLDGVYQRAYRTGNNAPTGSPTATLSNGVEDTSYTLSAADLLAGFTDADGDTLSVANLSASNGATVINNGNGTFTITLAANFNGTLTLNYNVIDGKGGTKAATQTVSIAAVNDAPTGSATATLAHGAEDTAYTVSAANLIAGFSDIDGDTLTVTNVTASNGATVTNNGDGTFTITPAANFNGTVTLSYTVSDGHGGTKTGSQTIIVDSVNDAPTGTATATLAHGTEDTGYTVSAANLLAGFSDVDGDTLSVTSLTASNGATVTNNGNGTFTITPAANFNGTITLSYAVSDGHGGTKAGSQSVVVDAVNDAPTGSAAATLAHGTEDTAYTVSAANLLAGFSDIDGNTLSVTNLTASNGATVTNNGNGTFTITPAANFNGTITLSYTVSDGNGGTKAGSQAVVFDAVNDAPIGTATATLADGTEDMAYTVSAANLLAGFSDVDGNTLAVTNLTASNGATVTNNGDGTFTITPAANFNGAVTLSYTVSDGHGGTKAGSQTVVFDPVNDAPTGAASAVLDAGTEDTSYIVSATDLLAGFSDIDGDTLSISGLTASDGATVTDNGDGTFTITPTSNFNGTVTLSYTVSDGNGGTKAGSQTVVFDAVNDAPTGTATAALVHGTEDTGYTVTAADLLAGFSDIDGDTLSVSGLTASDGATVTDNGDGTYTITPAGNFNGTVTLSYTVSDGNGGTKAGSQTVVFDAVNDAPTGAAAESLALGTEDTSYTVSAADLLAGFSDVDGDTLSVTGLTASDSATVTDNGDGTYTITPAGNFNGTVTLSYTVSDGSGGTKAGSQTVAFDAVNDAPTGAAMTSLAHGTEDTGYTVSASDLLAGFSDVDGDSLSVSGLTASDGAAITDNGDGTYTITPAENFNGTVTLSYTVSDSNGGTKAGSQAVVFDAVNDAPTGAAMTSLAHGTEDTGYTVSASDLLAGFSDVDGDSLSVSGLTASDGATVTDNGDGTYTITPVGNFNGTVTLSYTVSDGNGGTKAGSQTAVFDAVNDAPTGAAAASLAHGTEDTGYTVSAADLLAGFSDIDGDALSVSGLTASDGATVTDNGDGTYTISLATNFNGALTLSYNVVDGNGGSKAASCSVTIAPENDAPTGSATAVLANGTEDTSYTLSADDLLAGFSDGDGDTLAITNLVANHGASITDNGDGTFTIGLAADFHGQLTLSYDVVDGKGGSVSATQSLTVDSVNDAPTVANAIANQSATEDQAFSFQFASNVFADVDTSDTLTYTATLANGDALPSWLIFDSATRTFSGTPGNSNVGTISIKVTAKDGANASVSDTFDITVGNFNDAPTVANAIADQSATEDQAFSFQFASNVFADIDAGDTLAYTAALANGDALPSWLTFDAATRTFSGTPDNSHVGTISIKLTATDGSNASISDTFDVTVGNVNDAPTVANTIANQSATENQAFSFQFASDVFADIDAGDTLTYTATLANGDALPSWLTFDAATRTFSGTPGNSHVGTISIKLTATDGSNASISDTFDITVGNVNDAPTVANAIADQTATEDQAFTFQFASDVFADVDDGDTLTYAATLGDGGSLPSWLTFDAATRTFSGTPANGDVGTVSVKVTATDGSNGSISDTFDVTIGNVNDAPTAASKTLTVAEDVSYLFNGADFSFADLENNGFAGITISSLGSGSLRLDGASVAAGQFVDADDLDLLTWSAGENINGSGFAAFSFTVTDDGGTTNGGTDTSSNEYAITFDVNEVVDRFIGTRNKDKLLGTDGGDILRGRYSNDQLTGGHGDDTLTGGKGIDRFIFREGDGKDTIRDFDAIGQDHDIVDLSDLQSVNGFRDLVKHHLEQVGKHILIDGLNGDEILLRNIDIKDLNASDFVF
jgi:hypothetical protein